MSYEKVLGEVLRDVRLHAGIPYENLAGIISETNLRDIEKGISVSKLSTLIALCKAFGITPSQVLLVVEARLSGQALEAAQAVNAKMFRKHLEQGVFDPIPPEEAARGVRGQRANFARSEALRMREAGISKAQIARELGVTVRTVERYCARPSTTDGTSGK